ncbi:glycerate kinase [Thioalkalivibrio sp. ARh3]|uniref:glycerate kinase family protein n=1 Tax=Thioalkalivibrio sp. ARh3 TaxID=1158148 RepID=UPI00035FC499|nr:glycerate kinase [Thioalkalivibrio sp. ARh3]
MLCPDSFKGSLDAAGVAEAMARGVRVASPSTRIQALPMADGGEGTAELVSHTLGWAWHLSDVRDPCGRHVSAGWGYDEASRRAVIDVASACGLDLVPEAERDPWKLDTRGVGDLILAVLDAGGRHVLIGLGGSGTVDGGAGMLHALGVRFRDREGRELEPVPERLEHLASADFSGLEPRLEELRITVLNDVDNPLTGARGAAAVFGPQKGLAASEIPRMDACMERLARAVDAAGELRCPGSMPGAGAAGGLGFALACVLRGQSRMGAGYLADLIELEAAIAGSDLVVTGEGQLDGQTAHGKVVAEVIRRARRCSVPVAVVAGSIDATAEDLDAMGLADARALCDGTITLEQAMEDPGHWIMERTRAIVAARVTRPD